MSGCCWRCSSRFISPFPSVLLWFALSHSQMRRWETRLFAGAWAFTVAGLLTLYLIERSEPVQTESIGAALACGYVLAAIHLRDRGDRIGIVACGLFALAAIGMKEPFVLAVLAAALLVVKTRSEFIRAYVLPIILVVIAGAAVLALLGAGWEYLNVYLPAMLGGRVGGTSAEPLLVRGFAIAKVLNDLGTENESNPLFACLIGALWLAFPTIQSGASSMRQIVTSAWLWYSGI